MSTSNLVSLVDDVVCPFATGGTGALSDTLCRRLGLGGIRGTPEGHEDGRSGTVVPALRCRDWRDRRFADRPSRCGPDAGAW